MPWRTNREAGWNPAQPHALKRIVATGALSNLVFAAMGSAVTYLQSIIAIRILGPEQIGLYAMASAIAVTLEWVSDFGIGDQLIQEDDANFQDKFDTAVTVYVILALALAAATVGIAPFMARVYHQPPLSLLVTAISYAAFIGLLRLPLSLLVRDLKYVRQRVLLLAGRVVSFVVTVTLALKGAGAWALVAGGFCGLVVTGIPAWLQCHMRPRLRISRALLKPLFRFSSPVWVSKIAYVLVQQGSVLVLSAYLALDDVGRFKASEQVAYFIFYVETVLAQTMFPVFCRLKDSDGMLRSAFTKASRISMFWISASALGLTLFAPDIVRYVLTERWHGAELFLRAQGIALFFGATISGWESLLKARNRTRVIFQMSVFFGICFTVIFIPAVAVWGRVGAAGAVIVISAIILVTRVIVLSRLGLGISIVEIGWRATTAGVLAVAAVLVLSGFSPSSSLLVLAARVALYLVVYACTLLTLELNLLREILPLLLPQSPPRVVEAVEQG